MKNGYILLLIGLLFIGSCTQSQINHKDLEEFVTDLSSSNIKLRGNLMLFGKYKGDLSGLTYSHYLELLKENETKSSKGVVETIIEADKYVFATKRNSFIIAIYSKELGVVLYDDANTAFTDSILIIKENTIVPDLLEFISKTGYEVNDNKK